MSTSESSHLPTNFSLLWVSLKPIHWFSHCPQYPQKQRVIFSFQKLPQITKTTIITDRPSPATQCTATQLPGCVENRSRSNAKKRSTTSGGGSVPSSNGKSYIQTDRHTERCYLYCPVSTELIINNNNNMTIYMA